MNGSAARGKRGRSSEQANGPEHLLIGSFTKASSMTASETNKAAVIFASEATYTFDESYEDEDANDTKGKSNCKNTRN